MTMTDDSQHDELEEDMDLGDDEDATLADDLLDEVSGDDAADDEELMEGFGILPEVDDADDDKDDEEDEDGEESLEEDAEDVDFDRFDDVDEM
jgi:ribonuclease E